MSGKRAKQQRRQANDIVNFIQPLKPILDQALRFFEDDIQETMNWAVFAMLCHDVNPDIELSELLPSKLEKTVKKYKINEQLELLEKESEQLV